MVKSWEEVVVISEVIRLSHGSGGTETREILERLIFSKIDPKLKRISGGIGIDWLDDGALIPLHDGRYLVVTVDSYTVNPIFFPGGNIGSLAASGTLNDVLMMGGKPIALLDSIVVEEGFPVEDLQTIVDSFISIIRSEGVALIGGDFKVMPKGQVDKIVITTTGIGISDKPIVDKPKAGDKIIVSDYIGDHGAVIMMLQLGLEKRIEELSKGALKSDVKPLSRLMIPLIEKYGDYIHAARDPTRGGLSGVLSEWVASSDIVIVVNEDAIPIREAVARYCEMLGVDPLYLASEGVAVLSIDSHVADEVVNYMKSLGYANAKIIGEVKTSEKYRNYVIMKTAIGGFRILEPPHGELVPRIC
ncbi:MAG: hydrogenase expression/formation protein HypE [Ignisphaera sp.]|nr:hydrogenase expression/formation protein HypE [Ignisphaera sp.]MCX8168277.1 hydrogenase expression/formation protein HypE [Ignisphaera sp.]MDW8086040.1 hydrogenase expression/formation protein HypE [Ignisphaera sp.]